MQLSVVIPIVDRRESLSRLLPALRKTLPAGITYEVLVAVHRSSEALVDTVAALGARLITAPQTGYGSLLKAGLPVAQGKYILTLDADLSHPPDFVPVMWHARRDGEVVVASRYAPHGAAHMPWLRQLLSHGLNLFFRRGLSLAVDDLSSGFRLYRADILRQLSLQSTDFDVLEEILIRSHAEGWRIVEVPFTYRADPADHSRARPIQLSWAFLRTFYRMWKLRNSIDSADYDYRAFNSPVPPQRYWQRRRHRIVLDFARGAGHTLDVGCGSSRILLDLPDAVGLDIRINKLRFMHRLGARGLGGSAFALPFADASFDCVISSELIEHLPADPRLFAEMRRVLRPGGRLIVGTPDYGGWIWPTLEFLYARLAPGGYADEHITHYTQESLRRILESYGFQHQETRWVGGGEMIMKSVKSR